MKKFVYTLIIVIIAGFAHAQDPEFTQFYANPVYLNPAFAGTAKGPRFISNYRNQWASIPGTNNNFVTYAASFDQHFNALSGGISFQVLHDKAGDGELTTTYGSFGYSYLLPVNPKFAIKLGLQAGVFQKSLDFSKLVFGDQLHPRLGIQYETKEQFAGQGLQQLDPQIDFSAGAIAYSKKFYAGVAVNHINEPKQSFLDDAKSVLPMKITSHIGMLIPLDNTRHPDRFFSPNILFQKQGTAMQINLGGYYINNKFISGIWFRQTSVNTDALMALVGLKVDPFKIGYSYDITFSEARYGARGSHELSIILELPTRTRVTHSRWREFDCPDF